MIVGGGSADRRHRDREEARRERSRETRCDQEIGRRMADAVGFRGPAAPLGRRTHTGLAHPNRRRAKDFEATIASAKAWLYLASVQLLIRRLARG
jgi:hypothetical protein